MQIDFIDTPQILCAQLNQSLIDTNAINKQDLVENPKNKRRYVIGYLSWHHQVEQNLIFQSIMEY